MPIVPEAPWASAPDDVLEALGVSAERGLDPQEAKRRRSRHGPNRLREAKRRSAWRILLDQFASIVVILLVTACVLSFAFGKPIEGIAILAVLLINSAIGFLMEMRAVRSMEALRKMGRVDATVRRGGKIQRVPAAGLVPGDIVLVEGGDVVTADLRILSGSNLKADESALTGESVPVEKRAEPVADDTPLAERRNMLFKGTAVTRGSGEGVVVATGMKTRLGEVASLVEEAEGETTPLERRLDALGRRLVWVTLVVAAAVAAAGALSGRETLLIIETALALAVAAVPEGLPIVATVALSRGMWRMARRNALVAKLSSVETLGSTGVILTDKTGTLTENRMRVVQVVLDAGTVEIGGREGGREDRFAREGEPVDPEGDQVLLRLLTVCMLCNNASFPGADPGREDDAVGDPMETALLAAGRKAGLERGRLSERFPHVREVAFSPETRMMATFHEEDDGHRVMVKGAPEAVLDACTRVRCPENVRSLDDGERGGWNGRNEEMAEEGLRVLAVAEKSTPDPEADPYGELTLLGLVGLADPPRRNVRDSVASCRRAGIRVIMVTGDHAATARAIAKAVGLDDGEKSEGAGTVVGRNLKKTDRMTEEEREVTRGVSVFARVDPRQKLDLIALHQETGAIVAMTGDGVNDAPALKKADIGVAMGKRGTQVAREAADIVLQDDEFSTIVAAVEQGRITFGNIRRFVLYLLSCNMSEILVVGIATVFRVPLPILPLQILFLNLVTDVFPALALGVGEGEPGIMRKPPRPPGEPILARPHWIAVAVYGVVIGVSVLGALLLALGWFGMETGRAVTISFLTLAFGQLWHVFNMRERASGTVRNEITRNPWVWAALLLCTGLLVSAVYLSPLSRVLRVVDPGPAGWVLVGTMSLVPLGVGQVWKAVAR